jgi:hypothetical protein
MVDMLGYMGKAYGYEIYKHYREIFPTCTLRLIYYHLRKGVTLGEFAKDEVRTEKGNYSWGGSSEQHVYSLGRNASPHKRDELDKYFKGKHIKHHHK